MRSLALMVVLGLGACTGTGTGGGTVYYTAFTAGYVPNSLAAAHPLLVETYGSPTPGVAPENVLEATVAGLRQSGPAWMPRNYTGRPDDAPRPAYRLRIAYGAPKAFDRQDLCGPDMSAEFLAAGRGQNDAGSTRTLAGLCRGETEVAYGEGSPGANPDIRGERFQKFVGLLGRAVMPRRNPVTDDDCVFRNCD
ncbi:MAG: hypothetical protein RH942_18255 [Kiloniellaceae bacterium]